MAALRKYDSDTLDAIKELIDERKSSAQIAEELRMPESTVKHLAAKNNWHFNSVPQAKETKPNLDVGHIWDKLLRAKAK